MRTRKVSALFAGILVAGIFFTACNTGSGTADLPISTVSGELGSDGFIQCYTNDPQYYGYAMSSIRENGGRDTYEIECKKMSGADNYPYGMLFGVSNTDRYQYYGLHITCSGDFRILKRNGDEVSEVLDWTKTDKLSTGYNIINTLRVTNSGSSYTVFLNDTQVHQFTDSAAFGKRIGFYASVGEEEDEIFPNDPVDVRFRVK